jgi:dystonin
MSELETRESQFASVMDRGESLIISHHPASQVIEAHMLAMQDKWAWLLQLSLCMETHLKHTGTSQRFFSECTVAEEFLTQKEEILNNHFSGFSCCEVPSVLTAPRVVVGNGTC